MAAATIVGTLAEYVNGLTYENLPPDVVELAKTRILNHLAVSFPATTLPASVVAWKTVRNNKGPCTLLGHPEKVPAQDAAMYNSVTGHQVLQEDVGSGGHPGLVAVPAVLAAGEEAKVDGKQIITAIVIAYELQSRIGRGFTDHNRKSGFRSVSLNGVIGAAGAAAKLFSLDREQTSHALAFASVLASGFYQGFAEGTMDPFYEGGFASRNGILAAVIAQNGGTAASLALEGADGFYRAFTGTVEKAQDVVKDLGKGFDIRTISYKPYATSFTNQQPTDLAVSLGKKIGTARDIKYAVLKVSDHTRATAGKDNLPPYRNMTQAAMSLRFVVAAGLTRKPITSFEFFRDHYDDPELWDLAHRVQVVGDVGRRIIALEARLQDGSSLHLEEDRSHIFQPKTEKIVALFNHYAQGTLDGKRSKEIIDTVMNLEGVKDINHFTAMLAGR